jgi:hypothetical protein
MFQLGETPVEGAIAWKARDFADPVPLCIALGNRERAAIDQIMAAPPVKAVPFCDITRGMFSHPDLDVTLSRVFSEIMRGRGLAVLRGMSAVSAVGTD